MAGLQAVMTPVPVRRIFGELLKSFGIDSVVMTASNDSLTVAASILTLAEVMQQLDIDIDEIRQEVERIRDKLEELTLGD